MSEQSYSIQMMFEVDERSEGDSACLESVASFQVHDANLPAFKKHANYANQNEVSVMHYLTDAKGQPWDIGFHINNIIRIKREFTVEHLWPVAYLSQPISLTEVNLAAAAASMEPERSVVLAVPQEGLPHLVIAPAGFESIHEIVEDALQYDFIHRIEGALEEAGIKPSECLFEIGGGHLTPYEAA